MIGQDLVRNRIARNQARNDLVATDRCGSIILPASDELADVMCYCLALANELGIDVSTALSDKMVKNAKKYPAQEYRGRYGPEDIAST